MSETGEGNRSVGSRGTKRRQKAPWQSGSQRTQGDESTHPAEAEGRSPDFPFRPVSSSVHWDTNDAISQGGEPLCSVSIF